MILGAVRPDGQWWTQWQRLDGEDTARILEDLSSQVRGSIPASARVYRQFLSCYPRHSLLRLVVSGEDGPRESFAFYAPGQVYPLDWGSTASFDDVALEIKGPEQAEAYLRFVVWSRMGPQGRMLLLERPDQLRMRDGASLTEAEEAALEALIKPLEQLPNRPDDPDDSYRFSGSFVTGNMVLRAEYQVGRIQFGKPEHGLQRLGSRLEPVDEPEPLLVPAAYDPAGESDRTFVLLRETSLTAEEFSRAIKDGPLHQVRVSEPVVLRHETFSQPVQLSQISFDRGVDFTGARFERGLILEQCTFEGQLSLRDAHVTGSIQAPGLWFHREGHRRVNKELTKKSRYGEYAADLEASGMRVEGSAYFEGLQTSNLVDFSRARVDRDLRLGGSRIGSQRESTLDPRTGYALRLDNAVVGGDLDFVYVRDGSFGVGTSPDDRRFESDVPGFSTPRSIVGGTILASGLTVGRQVFLQGLRCEGDVFFDSSTFENGFDAGAHHVEHVLVVLGDLWLQGAQIGGGVWLHGAQLRKDLIIRGTRIEGAVSARTRGASDGRVPPARVGGTLDLSGSTMSELVLSGASLDVLRVETGEMARITIRPGIVAAALEESQATSASGSTKRKVRLAPANIGELHMSDVSVGKRISIEADIERDAEMDSVRCGGDIGFWDDHATREALDDRLRSEEGWEGGAPTSRFETRTRLGGSLRCRGLRVEGQLVLNNVSAKGEVLLKNCVIEQDVHCGSVGADLTSKSGRTRTTCSHLDLELTVCRGDIDLSGLDVRGEPGTVHARQLSVTGRVLFARPLGGEMDPRDGLPADIDRRVQAEVSSDVDLSVAEAAQLVVAGSSFKGRLNLERGRFRRLDVLEAREFTEPNLSEVQVDHWQIADEDLRPLLAASKPFARATYVEIEKVLRNRAQDGEADRVYRAMKARAIRETRRERAERRAALLAAGAGADQEGLATRIAGTGSYLLRTVGSRLQGMLYGWGTLYWAPLLVFTVLCLPLSWALMSEPENIDHASESVEAGFARPITANPDAASEWGAIDGLWMTVRHHVPVVPLNARSEYRPARRGALLEVPGVGWLRFVFSTETYAVIVYLLSWILWPLFLVGLARRIVRETT